MGETGIVQALLTSNETCSNSISGHLVDGDAKRTKVLAVINHQTEAALFVYDPTGIPGSTQAPLLLDRALPIRRQFQCSLRKGMGRLLNMDTVIDVTTDSGDKLVFELPSNTQMAQFLDSLQKASFCSQKVPDEQLSFSWLAGYHGHQTSGPLNDPPVGNLLDLDEMIPGPRPLSDPLLFGGDYGTATVEPSNAIAMAADMQTIQEEQSSGEWPWSEITARHPGGQTPVAGLGSAAGTAGPGPGQTQSLNSRVGSVAERVLDSTATMNPCAMYGSGEGAYVKYTVPPPKRRLQSRDNSFIGVQLKLRENEYTAVKLHRVFCGTWNVNGQPVTEGLHEWLGADPDPPQIYAIGFQELDLSAEALLLNDSSREDEWQRQAELALHKRGKYYKLRSLRLVGMLLIVYAHEILKDSITDIQAVAQGTGILGLMGNKGGVSIRFNLHNTSICFVNSHLAAHVEEVERRNQDYADICNKLQFSESRSILEHDVVVWMGDLNYRLTTTQQVPESKMKEMAKLGKFDELLHHDQLTQQIKCHNVFQGFSEGLIRFKPTYKFDPGTDYWDSSEKARAPAWCDRILWRTSRGSMVNICQYRCHPSLRLSDHKPVSALYDVEIKLVDKSQRSIVLSDLHQKLDKFENETKPVVALNTLDIVYKDVKFGDTQTRELIIRNTGQSHVDFLFKPRPEQDNVCKSWLRLKPMNGFIPSGKQQKIILSVYVDIESLPHLNAGKETLEDILVFHVEGGADSFITVRGNFLPTCFGMPLAKLVKLHRFVRQLPVPVAKLIEFDGHGSDETKDEELPQLSIPKELWMLTDYLYNWGLETEGLFAERGLRNELGSLIEMLDTGIGKLACSVHTAAEAFLLFLDAFPESVIPASFHQKCMECCNNYTLCKQLLMRLPIQHRNLFKYLAAFLRELLSHSDMNKLDAKTLATVFGSMCLRGPKDPAGKTIGRKQLQHMTKKKAAFFYNFLINEYDD